MTNERDIEREISLAFLSGVDLCKNIVGLAHTITGARRGIKAAEDGLKKHHEEKFGLTKGE